MFAFARHESARAFLERAEAWLLGAEDHHNLILGIAYGAAERGGPAGDELYATVEADGAVVGCVIRTPPYKLLVTDMPLPAAVEVAATAASVYDEIPGVLGPPPVAEAIAEAWVARAGGGWRPGMEQRIYRLDEVVPPEGVPGALRHARLEDLELALEWGEGFARDVGQDFGLTRGSVAGWIGAKQLYLWEDGEPRCIAVARGRTPRGVRVGYVYTPPESRRRGYAAACVAAVSQRMLDDGLDFCVLYTDLSNPTSNNVYQRVGYRPLVDVRDYDLIPERLL